MPVALWLNRSCQAPMVVVPSVDALPTAGSLVLRGGDGTPLGCVIESDGSAHCDLEPASWFLTGRVVALDGGSHALDLQRKSPLYFD